MTFETTLNSITEKKPDAGAKRQETQKGECVPN